MSFSEYERTRVYLFRVGMCIPCSCQVGMCIPSLMGLGFPMYQSTIIGTFQACQAVDGVGVPHPIRSVRSHIKAPTGVACQGMCPSHYNYILRYGSLRQVRAQRDDGKPLSSVVSLGRVACQGWKIPLKKCKRSTQCKVRSRCAQPYNKLSI